MTFIGTVYITELVSLIGIEQFSNGIFILFTFSAGVNMNLSTSWRNTSISMVGNMLYYFVRLGFHSPSKFPIHYATVCIICCVFYLINVLVNELGQRKDKALINKYYENGSHGYDNLLESLPYPILIQTSNKPVWALFNTKLTDMLGIKAEDVKTQDITSKIENKIKNMNVTVYEENEACDQSKS